MDVLFSSLIYSGNINSSWLQPTKMASAGHTFKFNYLLWHSDKFRLAPGPVFVSIRHFTAMLYATENLRQSLNCCCVTFSQTQPFEEHWKILQRWEKVLLTLPGHAEPLLLAYLPLCLPQSEPSPPFFCKMHTHTQTKKKVTKPKKGTYATKPIPTESLDGLQGYHLIKWASEAWRAPCWRFAKYCFFPTSAADSWLHTGGFWGAVCWISTLLWLRYGHPGKLIYL